MERENSVPCLARSHRRPLSWTSLRHSTPLPVISSPVVFPLSPWCRHAVFLSGFPLICVCNSMPSTPAAYPAKLIFDLITLIVEISNYEASLYAVWITLLSLPALLSIVLTLQCVAFCKERGQVSFKIVRRICSFVFLVAILYLRDGRLGMFRSKTIKWAGQVACMWEENSYVVDER